MNQKLLIVTGNQKYVLNYRLNKYQQHGARATITVLGRSIKYAHKLNVGFKPSLIDLEARWGDRAEAKAP